MFTFSPMTRVRDNNFFIVDIYFLGVPRIRVRMVGFVIRTGTLLHVIVEPRATRGQCAIDVRTTVKARNTLIRFFC